VEEMFVVQGGRGCIWRTSLPSSSSSTVPSTQPQPLFYVDEFRFIPTTNAFELQYSVPIMSNVGQEDEDSTRKKKKKKKKSKTISVTTHDPQPRLSKILAAAFVTDELSGRLGQKKKEYSPMLGFDSLRSLYFQCRMLPYLLFRLSTGALMFGYVDPCTQSYVHVQEFKTSEIAVNKNLRGSFIFIFIFLYFESENNILLS
jgi:hypothetical protein